MAAPAPNALAKAMATGKYAQPGRTISGGASDPNALGKLWSSGGYSAPTGGKGFVSSPGIKQSGDPYANAINSGDPSALAALGKALAGAQPPAAPPAQPPLDSTYSANVANNQFKTGNEINSLNQTSGYARTNLATQLGQLQQKQPLDTENMREKYNNQGLLYSGHLGQALGQLGQSYADKQAGLQSSFNQGQAARDSRVAALQQGEPLYEQGQAAASTGRATTAAAADQTLAVPATPTSSVTPKYGGQGGLTVGGGGGFRLVPGSNGRAVIGAGGKIMSPQEAHLSMAQLHALLNQRNK